MTSNCPAVPFLLAPFDEYPGFSKAGYDTTNIFLLCIPSLNRYPLSPHSKFESESLTMKFSENSLNFSQ